jgi:hypothetical protein
MQEASWSDLCPHLDTLNVFARAWAGLTLVLYWGLSRRVWATTLHSRYLLFSMIAYTLIFLAWYWGVLAAALIALNEQKVHDVLHIPTELSSLTTFAAGIGQSMGGWSMWLMLGPITSLRPVKVAVDIAYTVKCHLRDRDGLAMRCNDRILEILREKGKSGTYEFIIVLAHSFGAVLAVNALSAYRRNWTPVRLVTLGTPLRLVAARSQPVERAIATVLESPAVTEWTDIRTDADLMCTDVPVIGNSGKLRSIKLEVEVGLLPRLTGDSHQVYFRNADVYAEVSKAAGGL